MGKGTFGSRGTKLMPLWQETMSSAQIKGVGRSGKGEALSQVPNSPEGSVQLPVGNKNKVHSATLSAN